MADKILHKRSYTPGSKPTTSNLDALGEIAINVNDGKAFLTTSTTTTTTTVPPSYNYYTFTPCGSGTGTDYRSELPLALGAVYAFLPYPPDRACYEITSITASPNTNDLPTLYGPLTGCLDDNCQQL